jgi:U3 small nucleolar RNA-associated protein 11
MLSSKSKQGRKIADRGNPVLSHEAVKLLKTQDSGYLRTMIQKTRRALEKLEKEFVLREGQGAEVLGELEDHKEGQHVVFVDTREDQKQYIPGQRLSSHPGYTRQEEDQSTKLVANEADGDTEMASTTRAPRSRRALEREEAAQKEERLLRKQHKKEQDARRSKLAALKSREKDLIDAENELELQRAKMSNSVGGVTKAGVKWKVKERKK